MEKSSERAFGNIGEVPGFALEVICFFLFFSNKKVLWHFSDLFLTNMQPSAEKRSETGSVFIREHISRMLLFGTEKNHYEEKNHFSNIHSEPFVGETDKRFKEISDFHGTSRPLMPGHDGHWGL